MLWKRIEFFLVNLCPGYNVKKNMITIQVPSNFKTLEFYAYVIFLINIKIFIPFSLLSFSLNNNAKERLIYIKL